MGAFDGKVALVTGAASGIGRASAQLFAAAGARVVVSDVDDAGGKGTVELVTAAGGEAVYVHCDVSSAPEVEALVAATIDAFGRLDYAHNNVGIAGSGALIPDYPLADWDRGIGVMLSGVFLGMKYQIPRILEQGGGAIVNTSSGAGLIGFPGMCAYVAAKHGVIGLTKTAALEYATQNIRVNCICPGTAKTGMVNDWINGDPALEKQVSDLHPIGRIAEPEEIAQAAIWLCSDASSFVTGSVLSVDGGYTAAMSATDLDDREGIRRLLAIYGQLLDDRRVEEWGELFTEDATFLVWGNTSAGRAAIVADIGGMQPPDAALRHLVTSTVIDLRGDGTARVWADFMVAMRVGDELTVAAVGRYYDRVVRDGDRWRFASRVIVPLGDEVPEGVELPPPH